MIEFLELFVKSEPPTRLCYRCFRKRGRQGALYYAFTDKGPCKECGTEVESRDSVAVKE